MSTTASIPPSPLDKPPRSRRSIPRSLQIFAGILALLGISGTWILWQGYQQKALIDEIRNTGGYVQLEPVGPDWLRQVMGTDRMQIFDRVVAVVISSPTYSDDRIRRLRRWKTLTWLIVRSSQFTDESLEELNILPDLKKLVLSYTSVTDAGLGKLGGLKKLTSLGLAGEEISDAGLRQLRSLKNLKSLHLHETEVTDDGVAELEQALPQLKIVVTIGSRVYRVDEPEIPTESDVDDR